VFIVFLSDPPPYRPGVERIAETRDASISPVEPDNDPRVRDTVAERGYAPGLSGILR
jgi:hypothetical protein